MALTDAIIKRTNPRETRFKMYDAAGLYIQIEPTGGKLWRFKYRFDGHDKALALGKYPAVSLSEARRLQGEAKDQLAPGGR